MMNTGTSPQFLAETPVAAASSSAPTGSTAEQAATVTSRC
ncbi:hypothetical protein EES40_21650 [Streptomyces sp. ADI93-02]|nr:hypothetical protein EES40_21650 [Streptomyces sp. ADI93-02]